MWKTLKFTILLLVLLPVLSLAADSENPGAVIAQRIESYNLNDLEGFLEAHAEDVKILAYPERLLGIGHDHLRNNLGERFENPAIKVDVVSQIELGNYVITEEVVRDTQSGLALEHYVAIYEVMNGVIISVRFIQQ